MGARSLLSLFVDPERILRRLYLFAEEPCKSTITTSEPCSPVFKEAQPRPSKQSISLISRIGIFIIVHNVFLLLVIYCCNKASNRIVTRSKELVFYSWIPLSPEVSRLSPYIHTRTTTYANFKNLLHIRGTPTRHQIITPSLVENLMSRGRRDKSWIVSSRLRPYGDFSKHSQKLHNTQCKPNPGKSPHTRTSDLHLQQKK